MERLTSDERETPTQILVVDDEPDIELMMRQKMRRQIRKGRYAFDFALNGIEALEKLNAPRDPPYDLLVTDINMPKMNGLELLGEIARRNAEVKSIVVSAYGDMDNIRTAMNLGAVDFVTKPVDFDELETTIARTEEQIRTWRDAVQSRDRRRAREIELDMARTLQRSVLPGEMPASHRYEIEARMTPAREIGGDFFDIVKLEDEHLGIAVADVSGKGIPAALFLVGARSVLKGTAIGASEPGTVLSEMNRIIERDNPKTDFLTLVYMVYNPRTGEMRYANGGHPSPMVVGGDGTVSELAPVQGVAVGLDAEAAFEEGTATLKPGQTVVMYSDGVIQAKNAAGEAFGAERLKHVFEGHPPAGAEEAIRRIEEAVAAFSEGREHDDDLTVLALRRRQG